MKIYIISEGVNINNNPAIDEFHHTMFHGFAERNGKSRILFPREDPYYFNDNLEHSLMITKNVYNMSKIFVPSYNWVMAESVCKKLKEFSCIKFFKVKFIRFFNMPYKEYEFEHKKHLEYYYPSVDEYIITKEHDSKIEKMIEDYYEIILYPYYKINLDKYKNLKEVIVYVGPTIYDDDYKALLSKSLLNDYPMFLSGKGNILREDVYKILEPYFNWTYFSKTEVEI
jgi:hypothetical protein